MSTQEANETLSVRDGKGRVLLLIADPLSARVFFEGGIVRKLHDALGSRLQILSYLPGGLDCARWLEESGRPSFMREEQLLAGNRKSLLDKVHYVVDRYLDRRIGFFPLAIRFNLRNGFHLDRMARGQKNAFLNLSLQGPLPNWGWVNRMMFRWHFGSLRYIEPNAKALLKSGVSAIVASNLQRWEFPSYFVQARRLRIPVIGYVASWDHPVGKGVVWPGCQRYIVQNEIMKGDLQRYHGIDGKDIAVTGWPQTDVYAKKRPREDFLRLLRSFGLDPGKPCVLMAGNSWSNSPYEPFFVERLLEWREAEGGRDAFSLIIRPHPRDNRWKERFGKAMGTPGVHVQEPSYVDIELLATLLQHVACVVTNGGTILLDSVVNGRPAVCVAYDEGAPAGVAVAVKQVQGEHYRQMMESGAFPCAHSFEEAAEGIKQCLRSPGSLAEKRRTCARTIVGEIDGLASKRVVDAILAQVPRADPLS